MRDIDGPHGGNCDRGTECDCPGDRSGSLPGSVGAALGRMRRYSDRRQRTNHDDDAYDKADNAFRHGVSPWVLTWRRQKADGIARSRSSDSLHGGGEVLGAVRRCAVNGCKTSKGSARTETLPRPKGIGVATSSCTSTSLRRSRAESLGAHHVVVVQATRQWITLLSSVTSSDEPRRSCGPAGRGWQA